MSVLRSRGSLRQYVEADIDLAPLMNVFFAIVPMLLLSAVTLQITVIRLGLPSDAEAAPMEEVRVPTVQVDPDRFTVVCPGATDVVVDRHDDFVSARLLEALRAAKAIAPENQTVQVQPAPGTRYHEIVWVMDRARDVGLLDAALVSTSEGD